MTKLDGIIKIENEIIIRGYVLSDNPVEFYLKKRFNRDLVKVEAKRFKYRNLFEEIDNPEQYDEAGFFIKIQSSEGYTKLIVVEDGKEVSMPIRITVNYSGITFKTIVDFIYFCFVKLKCSLKGRGFFGTIVKMFEKIFKNIFFMDDKKLYIKWLKKQSLSKGEIEAQRNKRFSYEPLFSIIVPLFDTPEYYLFELIASIKAQTYGNWELCFSNGSANRSHLRGIIEKESEIDERIKYIDSKQGPLGISSNTNQALSIAGGDYIVLGDHDDLFSINALYECVEVLNKEKVDVIYTDEDKTDGSSKRFFDPHFKPDFNLGFFRSNNYICHMFVASKEIVDSVGEFCDLYNGAQDYDFILRCVERANSIYHIPKILYHWRFHMNSTAAFPESKLYAYEAGRLALEAHYKRLNIPADVEMGEDYGYYNTIFPTVNEEVSVISYNENTGIDKLNEMARSASGRYLLFMHESMEAISKNYSDSMLSFCQSEDVGAVGVRIYDKQDKLIQGGAVLGMNNGAGYLFTGQKDIDSYHGKSKYVSDYSIISGLCLMTKSELFLSVGGFDEKYSLSYFDFDYCLKLGEIGKRILYNPRASFSIEELPKLDERDREYFTDKWKDNIYSGDRAYNPNLSLKFSDYRVEI